MNRTRPFLAALAMVLAACSGGSEDDDASADSTVVPTALSTASTTAAPETAATPATATAADPDTSAPAGDSACLDGEWTISDIISSGLPLTVSGVGDGMTMTFATATASGTWTLRATDATIPATAAGTDVTLSLDGDASGQVATLGDQLQFVLDDADGTATVAAAGLEQELDFDEVIGALSPSGEATSTCSASAATLATSTTTIELTR